MRYDQTTALVIKVEVGSGDNVSYKNRTFNHINPQLTDAKLLSHAKIIGAWQSHAINAYIRKDQSSLEDD